MGYQLQSILLNGDDALAEEIRAAWPEARSKRVKVPFDGWMIALPTSLRDKISDKEPLADDGPAEDLRLRVMRWSRRMPSHPMIFIDTDCFGGTCLYTGYVCRDGELLREEPMTSRRTGALRRLVAALGVDLSTDEYFAPLTRGYFDQ